MLRSPIVVLSLPAGLAAGCLAWFVAGGPDGGARALAPLQGQLATLRTPHPTGPGGGDRAFVQMPAQPVFIMTTGPFAVTPPQVRLDGVVRTRRRQAALVAINDAPADWLTVGETRDGVTLQAIEGSRIVVDTLLGPVPIQVGETVGGAPPASTSGPSTAASANPPPPAGVSPTILDKTPPGFRVPPAPASAPGIRP